MTVRERGILALLPSPCRKALMQGHGSPSFLWKEVPRRGGGWLTKRNKKEWGRSIFPYRHPERSRRIFVAAASSPALLIRLHEAPYPTFMEYQASRFHSHAYTVSPQTKKISRLRSKRRYGKAVFSQRFLPPREGFGAVTRLSLLPMEGGAPKGRRLAHKAE